MNLSDAAAWLFDAQYSYKPLSSVSRRVWQSVTLHLFADYTIIVYLKT